MPCPAWPIEGRFWNTPCPCFSYRHFWRVSSDTGRHSGAVEMVRVRPASVAGVSQARRVWGALGRGSGSRPSGDPKGRPDVLREVFSECLPGPAIPVDSRWRNIVEVLSFAPERLVKGSVMLSAKWPCLWSDTASSELVPFDSHGDHGAIGADDHTRHDQLQPCSPVEQARPVDGCLKPLSGQQRPVGGEAQPRAT